MSADFETAVVESPETFGLTLENADERRAILSIADLNAFLAQDLGSIVPAGMKSQAEEFFGRHPEGMKQLFIKLTAETARLGDHSHAPVSEGGMGEECFLFTRIPAGSRVDVERYQLGRSIGSINYDIAAGTPVINLPDEFHTFTVHGPVSFLQVTEGPDFIPGDLRPFDEASATPEDIRAVRGML